MVSTATIQAQLKKIGFKYHGWGRTEVQELQNIILPDEEIFECVNGFYEGGFALLLATDVRVLLVDKKPLNYLTVEDLRFDMINEIDYNHRLVGAYIKISAGETHLRFSSLNQPRLRKLIGHVQNCMVEAKKKQATHPHLEQINQQLQSYLLAQYQQQRELQEQLRQAGKDREVDTLRLPEPVRPDPQLADYLYAQGLLAEHQVRTEQPIQPTAVPPLPNMTGIVTTDPDDLYTEGRQEIFGKRALQAAVPVHHLEIHPLRVVYGVLSHIILHNRKFGRPSLRVDGQGAVSLPAEA